MGKKKIVKSKGPVANPIDVPLYDVEAELNAYEVYMWVIENVVREVDDCFMSEGVDKQVLLDLQQIWIDKLKMTNAVDPCKKQSLQSAKNKINNNNSIKNISNENVMYGNYNLQQASTSTPLSNTNLQSFNPSHNISINQSTSQLLASTKPRNIVLTHTINTAPLITPFTTIHPCPGETSKDPSLTFQLLNKLNAEPKSQTLSKILVPTTHFTSTQLPNNNNDNKLMGLNANTNPTSSSSNFTVIRPDVKSKLLQQLQQQHVQHLQQQHTKHIVIQQAKQPQQTIRLLNTNNFILQPQKQQTQLSQPQQQQHIVLQNPRQQIILQNPPTTQQQQIIIQQFRQRQQQNLLLLRPQQPNTQSSPSSSNTTNSTSTKLPQLDGVGDDEESDEDDDDLAKLEGLEEVAASNGIYDDDEDEERDKPEENLVSDDDISVTDPSELFEVDNIIVCQYTKVNRKKIKSKWEDVRSQSKWSMTFRYGVMSINGKDILFNSLQGDACWP